MAGNNVVFTLIGRNLLSKTFQEASRDADNFDKRMTAYGAKTSNALVAVGAAAAVGIGQSINMAMDFDKTMRMVAVQTKESGAGLEELSDLAIQMGKDTVFSAKDASGAMLELAKGGLTSAQIKAGALSATMTLAAAGELEMASAATYVSNGMAMFGLKAEDATRVVTALAGGANASSASVESLGLALSQVGPGAKLAGSSIEETVAVLSAFDAMGIKGSDAGTSLKTMFMRLVPQTEKASGAMEDLGLKFTDARGGILPLRDIAEQLRVKLKGLSAEQKTTALTTLFGSDAYRAAALMAELGAKGVDKYTAATKDQTAAQELANVGMSGAAGAWENFKGSVETLAIQLGQKLLPTFTTLANFLTDTALPVISATIGLFNDLPGPVKIATGAILALAVIGPRLGAFAAAVRTNIINPVRTASGARGIGGLRAAAGGLSAYFGGPWGIGLTVATTLLGVLAGKFFEAKGKVDELTDALKADSGAIQENTRAVLAKQIADSGMAQMAAAAGLSMETATKAVLGDADALRTLESHAESLEVEFGRLFDRQGELTASEQVRLDSIQNERAATADLIAAVTNLSGNLAEGKKKHQEYTEAERAVKEATEAAKRATEQRDRALGNELAALGLSKSETARYTKALKDVPPEVRTAILADLRRAQAALDAFVKKYSGPAGLIQLNTDLKKWASSANLPGGNATELAAGGPVFGPGTSTSDSIPAMLSNGEYVVNARSTRKHYQLVEAINRDAVPMRASGGPVGRVRVRATADTSSASEELAEMLREYARAASSFSGAGGVSGVPSSVSGNAAIVKSIFASQFGWASHWPATYRLLMKESGFRNTAQNPTSTAYGMFQFLDSTWGGYGIPKTSDPRLQTIAGGRYISSRYGNPSNALAFHLRNNWYDEGGWLMPGQTVAYNGTGKPEAVFTQEQLKSFGGVHVHLDNAVIVGASPRQVEDIIVRAVEGAKARGRL